MDADADDVAGLDRVFLDRVQRFVDQQRCSVTGRRGRGEDVLPPRRNHGGAKRYVAWIDEVNAHGCLLERAGDAAAEPGEEAGGRDTGVLGLSSDGDAAGRGCAPWRSRWLRGHLRRLVRVRHTRAVRA